MCLEACCCNLQQLLYLFNTFDQPLQYIWSTSSIILINLFNIFDQPPSIYLINLFNIFDQPLQYIWSTSSIYLINLFSILNQYLQYIWSTSSVYLIMCLETCSNLQQQERGGLEAQRRLHLVFYLGKNPFNNRKIEQLYLKVNTNDRLSE